MFYTAKKIMFFVTAQKITKIVVASFDFWCKQNYVFLKCSDSLNRKNDVIANRNIVFFQILAKNYLLFSNLLFIATTKIVGTQICLQVFLTIWTLYVCLHKTRAMIGRANIL